MSSGLKQLISIYGPPGSGKSSLGKALAERMHLPFWDADEEIQRRSGSSIPELFTREGEAGFRLREKEVLGQLFSQPDGVIALGGGALLNPENRTLAERVSRIICLQVPLPLLLERLAGVPDARPLIEGDLPAKMAALLEARAAHYTSFLVQINARPELEKVLWDIQVRLGLFRVNGIGQGYPVHVLEDGLDRLGEGLSSIGLRGPVAIVSDSHVAPIYLERVSASLNASGFATSPFIIHAGEASKNIQTVNELWDACLSAGLERGSTVVALGGGVVGDLAGFAAATYLRGIAWVGVPTSLLAMVDSSLGGKTGVDLPRGKNLVGAFHSPRLVIADLSTLITLPDEEFRSGMAEVLKAGIIGDPQLFALCDQGLYTVRQNLDEIVRRAMAVKIAVISEDPYEKGRRAALNLGHTIGHAVELLSGYHLRHGEAVAIGMAAEARLAERLHLAEKGTVDVIEEALRRLELPVEIPAEMSPGAILTAMQVDKKRMAGKVRFALPVKIGEVIVGVEADPSTIFES